MSQCFFETKYLHILHQNIAGLLNKTDALSVNLDELSDRKIHIDVLCITEHFMKSGYEQFLNLQNYSLAACFSRNHSKRGGACILVEKSHKWKEIPEVKRQSLVNMFECCAIKLIEHKIIIVCVYRVPKQNNLNQFLYKLENILIYLRKFNFDNIVIAGDFNINILKSNSITLDFECLLLNYNLKLAIRQSTRLLSKTCLDNFAHDFKNTCKTEVLEFGLSDHTAQLLTLPGKKNLKLKYWRKEIRDYSTDNIQKFKMCIKNVSFSDMYNITDSSKAYTYFINEFRLFYDLCFPKKQIIIKVNIRPKWITRGIKICSKRKRDLLWNFRSKPSKTNKSKYENYTKMFKRIISLTKKAQNNYKIKTSKNKSKTTWNIIKKPQLNLPKDHILKININNKYITNPTDIANSFNNYFIDRVKPISGAGKNVTANISNREKSMFMAPCLPQQINKIIMSLKNTNSVGSDGIMTKMIKVVSEYVSPHISYLINLCIETGTFPKDLKVAIVKPLFKKANKELMEYYRPIAILSVFSKIFEKYYYGEINSYLEKNSILCKEQKGFRQNKTINMAIFDFLYNVICKVDLRIPVCSVYCDMTQAFDYVDHNILLNKLEAYGIRGKILNLIGSYLKDRQQITEITRLNYKSKCEVTHRSTVRKVKYGVPQGSVLGPLLFIVYINDLPKALNQPMTLFADDSTVTITRNDINLYNTDINNSFKSIILWLDNNNLKINLKKTTIMHFNQKGQNPSDIELKFGDAIISKVDNTRFLGLIIDQKLNWKTHIEEMSKRISSLAYVLHKLSTTVNMETLLTAYYGIVESVLRYGIIFWGNSTNKNIIFKMQKRCLRAMFRIKTTESCKPLFLKHRILSLPSLYILEVSLFVINNPHLFPRTSEIAIRSRRDDNKIQLHSSKTKLLSKSIICMASKIYNKIPKYYKELNNNLFKTKFKKLLIDKCYYSIDEFLNDAFL